MPLSVSYEEGKSAAGLAFRGVLGPVRIYQKGLPGSAAMFYGSTMNKKSLVTRFCFLLLPLLSRYV